MELGDLVPGDEQLKLLQGVEGELLRRRRAGRIGGIAAIGGILLEFVIATIKQEGIKLENLNKPAELIGVIAVVVGFGTFVILRWTRLLLKESKEPFRYTFWIDEFERVKDTPENGFKLKGDDRLHLLNHDLMERLNNRIRRLSLLNEKTLAPGSPAEEQMTSHINISGYYAIREEKDDKWVIHVMPRVRIGLLGRPATLAYPVKYPFENGSSLSADGYNQMAERVYSSIATEVYRQIESDVKSKMSLFPTPYLRAVAYFYEAEDFARSNTIDAYDRAIDLYKEARRYFGIGRIKWIRKLVLGSPLLWRIQVRSEHMEAKVETGFAKCLIYRRKISALTGRTTNPLYEIRGTLNEVIGRIEKLHNKMDPFRKGRASNSFKAFLTFPKDSLPRLLSLRPLQSLFEKQRRIIFDAYVVAALTYHYLEAMFKAGQYLKKASAIEPQMNSRNSLYLLASAEIEPDLDIQILLFRQATENAPDFQIAQHLLAQASEMRFRAQGEIVEARAKSVIEEYDAVLKINPGNIAALAAQGYLWWLLDGPDKRAKQANLERAWKKFEEGREIKATVRETFVGELNYGLARIAAETGRFNACYDLYSQAMSADPGISAYSVQASKRSVNSYYQFISPDMLNRYQSFEATVGRYRRKKKRLKDGEVPERILNAVHSFAMNDYGNACLNYYNRFGDRSKLDTAIDVLREAVKANPENVAARFNLHFAYEIRGVQNQEDETESINCLEEVVARLPNWQAAVVALTLAQSQARTVQNLRDTIKEVKDKLENLERGAVEEAAIENSFRARLTALMLKVTPTVFRFLFAIENPQTPLASVAAVTGQSSSFWQSYGGGSDKERARARNMKAIRAERERQRMDLQTELKTKLDNLVADLREMTLPTLGRVVKNTSLSSLFEESEIDYTGKSVDQLLSNEKVKWERLDEDGVGALKAWAQVLASNDDREPEALMLSMRLCNHILDQYNPESLDVSWILLGLLDRIVRSDGDPNAERRRIEAMVKSAVANWLRQDPIHYLALEFEAYFEVKYHEEVISRALRIEESNVEYRKSLARIYERAMQRYLAQIDDSPAVTVLSVVDPKKRAIQQYETALKVAPNDPVFLSDFAREWEDFRGAGRSVKLDAAIAALQQALTPPNPQNEDYQERLQNLLKRRAVARHFGEKALDWLPATSPITVEIAANLWRYVEVSEGTQLQTAFSETLEKMSQAVFASTGVFLPKVTLRKGVNLLDGSYTILLNDIPRATRTIREDEFLFPGTSNDLKMLGVFGRNTTNPQSGIDAAWVSLQDREKVIAAGYNFCTTPQYIVLHLEGTIRQNLVELVGLQKVMNMLNGSFKRGSLELDAARIDLGALTSVVRRLVAERVPITAFTEIVELFNLLRKNRTDVAAIVEVVRSSPPIRPYLPGNNDQYSFYQLGNQFEGEISKAILKNPWAILAIDRERMYKAMRDALGENLDAQQNVALLAAAKIRPFARRLVELAFEPVPVLSRQELLPGLEQKIVGEIELNLQP